MNGFFRCLPVRIRSRHLNTIEGLILSASRVFSESSCYSWRPMMIVHSFLEDANVPIATKIAGVNWMKFINAIFKGFFHLAAEQSTVNSYVKYRSFGMWWNRSSGSIRVQSKYDGPETNMWFETGIFWRTPSVHEFYRGRWKFWNQFYGCPPGSKWGMLLLMLSLNGQQFHEEPRWYHPWRKRKPQNGVATNNLKFSLYSYPRGS
jgi:hypothetical protein